MKIKYTRSAGQNNVSRPDQIAIREDSEDPKVSFHLRAWYVRTDYNNKLWFYSYEEEAAYRATQIILPVRFRPSPHTSIEWWVENED